VTNISYASSYHQVAAVCVNHTLAIPGTAEEEQLDRFCEGLKPEIKLEVLKSPRQQNE
jgi:hypothetical protein